MTNGFLRVASCAPQVRVADIAYNVDHIVSTAKIACNGGADIAVFPEMCVTAYTCADLFHNFTLLDGAVAALAELPKRLAKEGVTMPIVVGVPLRCGTALYNCAAVVSTSGVHAVVPKTYLPNYNEFYERRWWQPADPTLTEISVGDERVPFGTDLLIDVAGAVVSIEICEDVWTPVPPSCHSAMAGAQVVLNLSASDDLIGKYAYLQSLLSQQSARCVCGYAYASAGYGESSTDLVFDAKTFIYENGRLLASNRRWQSTDQMVMADIDIEAIERDRMHMGSYTDCCRKENGTRQWRHVAVNVGKGESAKRGLMRVIDPTPFVPPTDEVLSARCEEITGIQAAGLAKRLDHIRCKTLVVGISGGLDSTLALLVAVKAFDRLGLDRKGIVGVTMPGYGTTGRTHRNAVKLMEALDVSMLEISIVPAVEQHFADIGHDPKVHDVTYENSQARERTQILMDIANQRGGIVLGTGDLSELALGWATYNGDHMSMYGVNTGVPKTLVKYLVRYFATETDNEECRNTLFDIIDTPISPELIPADANDNITQKTEDLVGPYELHDFFLYYTLRYGFTPERIQMLAETAFAGRYDAKTIESWRGVFFKRFFQQQFKRSCLPDGPKVGSLCLSPRGDWRMPSDASAALFV